jgi:hypothetical protein
VFPPKHLAAAAVIGLLAAFAGRPAAAPHPAPAPANPALVDSAWSSATLGTLNPEVFHLAIGAAACAVRSGAIDDLATLTVIDYSRPSTEKRLWVFDLQTRRLLFEELVAHGQGSGENMATLFSNQAESHQSSLGLFRTEDTYVGKNGYSLRLRGLDDHYNDQAYARAIVMHGAPYVSDEFARVQGRLGRSWGCPALREGIAREVIDTVKGRGLLFSYYPDPAWLAASKYLGDCAATAPSDSSGL